MLLELIVEFFENLLGGLDFTTLLIVIGTTVLFFLVIRELVTWYWKMNKIVRIQKEQNQILLEILDEIKRKK